MVKIQHIVCGHFKNSKHKLFLITQSIQIFENSRHYGK